MDLMIDIGNTHTLAGVFNQDKIEGRWRLSSTIKRTEDELWIGISSFFNNMNISISQIDGVCISSVVPELTLVFTRMTEKYFKKEPLIIEYGLDFGMDIFYEDVYSVGADRICNAVAGKKYYGCPLIILDFGTATTFDCIDKAGNYIGGVICPGIESAASVLHYKAAKLPKIELKLPPAIIGKNTEHSMQSGIMYGSIEMIEGLIKKIKNELDQEAKIVATGGLAELIFQNTTKIDFVDLDLNLKGIYNIYQKNK